MAMKGTSHFNLFQFYCSKSQGVRSLLAFRATSSTSYSPLFKGVPSSPEGRHPSPSKGTSIGFFYLESHTLLNQAGQHKEFCARPHTDSDLHSTNSCTHLPRPHMGERELTRPPPACTNGPNLLVVSRGKKMLNSAKFATTP